MLALCISGMLFSIFSGQPLLVLSFVLPLSLFDGILFSVSQSYDIDFLAFRMLTGLWAVVLLGVFVVVNLSSHLRYFTRFCLEIFVTVPAIVLLGYGFVHMCYMIQAYAALPGTFSNQTCLCVKTVIIPFNMSTTLSPNSTAVGNNSSLPNFIKTTVTPLINVTISNTTTVNNTLSTTGSTLALQQFKDVIQKDVHFRDCVGNEMFLKGSACMHGVYPFTSILTVSSIVLFVFLTSFQHFGYLPKEVSIRVYVYFLYPNDII
jgi:HCO3- transporter family.